MHKIYFLICACLIGIGSGDSFADNHLTETRYCGAPERNTDEQSCINHFTAIKWAEKERCPHCGGEKIYHFSDNKTHKCGQCRKKFSIRVGTIFEDSKIPLQKWFMAIYLATSHKKGISSIQLAKDIDVTQKTAWFMLHRLRHASQTKSFNTPSIGGHGKIVEIDETYLGGKEKNKHSSKRTKGTQGRSIKTKTAVLGMLERGGELRAMKVKNGASFSIIPVIISNVSSDTNVMTDEARAYKQLPNSYVHNSVNHGIREYVYGNIHTNTIEGAWSLFKRGILGIQHHISPKHLDRYLTEFSFRYNTRKQGEGERVNCLLRLTNGRITYKELIQ